MGRVAIGIVGVTPGAAEVVDEIQRNDKEADAAIEELKAQYKVIANKAHELNQPLWDKLTTLCGKTADIRKTHRIGYERNTKMIYAEERGDGPTALGDLPPDIQSAIRSLAKSLTGEECDNKECDIHHPKTKGDGDAD